MGKVTYIRTIVLLYIGFPLLEGSGLALVPAAHGGNHHIDLTPRHVVQYVLCSPPVFTSEDVQGRCEPPTG